MRSAFLVPGRGGLYELVLAHGIGWTLLARELGHIPKVADFRGLEAPPARVFLNSHRKRSTRFGCK